MRPPHTLLRPPPRPQTCVIVDPPPPVIKPPPPPPEPPAIIAATPLDACVTGTWRDTKDSSGLFWKNKTITITGKNLDRVDQVKIADPFRCRWSPLEHSNGSETRVGKWNAADESISCVAPGYSYAPHAVLAKEDMRLKKWVAVMDVSWDGGQTWVKDFKFEYEVCCTIKDAGVAVLWILLPLFIAITICILCCIYVLSKAPLPMPPWKHQEEPTLPPKPKLLTMKSMRNVEVQKPFEPPPPKEVKPEKKKKWATVRQNEYHETLH